MKVLVSAIACNPYAGSELYFGWSAVNALSRDHEVWVMTSGRNRKDFEKAEREGLIPPNLHVTFVEGHRPWHPSGILARIQSWKEYYAFAKSSLVHARQLHEQNNFDLVHHVTFATWRVASPLWQLGIPFVFGPVGGNEKFPFRIFSSLSTTAAAFELLRKTSNVVSRLSPSVRRSIRMASHVIAATRETAQLVARIRRSDKKITILSPGFYSLDRINAYRRFVPTKKIDGPLRIFASGLIGGHKGVALAFHALALAKERGVKFSYHIGSNGPEIPYLRRLASQLHLSSEIIFGDTISKEDYQQLLGDSHVYLLLSMRESVGLTMMEAMLAGCVPIVADCGGPNHIVTDSCGYKIRVSNRKRIIEDASGVIEMLDRDRSLIRDKGKLASERIAENFTEASYRLTIGKVYNATVRAA